MADHYSLCLLTEMDRLWFHQIILCSSHSSSSSASSSSSSILVPNKTLNSAPLLRVPHSTLQQQQTLPPQQKPINHHSQKEEARPTRMNPASTIRSRRSHSSSMVERLPVNVRQWSSMRELDQKYSMISCRSLRELEMEEVKGFIDLGFKFNKQNMNPTIARLVPGLLKFLHSNFNKFDDDDDGDDHDDDDGIIRPYLSEAWLIRSPNSPLLNFKLPIGGVSASAASDMKEHLKFWARTVATVIHQES